MSRCRAKSRGLAARNSGGIFGNTCCGAAMETSMGRDQKFTIKVLLPFFLFCTIVVQAHAAVMPSELEEVLPQDAKEILQTLPETEDPQTLKEGFKALYNKGIQLFKENFQRIAVQSLRLCLVVFLCSLVDDCVKTTDHGNLLLPSTVTGVLVITATTAGSMETMIGLAQQAIEELDIFSKALLPTLAAATATAGGVMSAGVRQVSTMVFANFLTSMIRKTLIPMTYFYIAILAANAVLPQHPFQGLSNGIRKLTIWLLVGSLTIFTGYLTISGYVSASGDALAVRAAKSVVSTAVPVVGSIISDAAGSVLSGAAVLKNSVGIIGILSILAVCLTPFFTIAAEYLLYKLASFLSGLMGESALIVFLNDLGGAFGLVLGMVASCGFLLLFSVISFLSAVTV